jgi:hypothetical protein
MDEVEMDYLFLTSPQFPEERVTVLVLALAVDGAIAATVGVKGVTPYMLRFAAGTMEVWGLKDIILKTDQEQAIMALSRSLKDERKDKTQLTNAPRYSHASMGVVERANQTLAGQIRSMRLVLQGHLGQRLPATHPLMAWVVRHAAWLITRFVVRPSGRTAYEALRGRAYRSELVEIGERVFAKKPGDSQNVTKLDSRWEAGIWVGKTETSEEHLVSTAEAGVIRMRVIRRRPLSERWSVADLEALRGAPVGLEAQERTGDVVRDLHARPTRRAGAHPLAGCAAGTQGRARDPQLLRHEGFARQAWHDRRLPEVQHR